MKPAHCKYPFIEKENDILFLDSIFYVPDDVEDLSKYTYSIPDFFEKKQEIHIECCSGNGLWIAERAKSHPHINFIAIEKKFSRVRKIWSKIKNEKLTNLIAVMGEGERVISHFIPKKEVHTLYVNFPDPWPKRRHNKKRIVKGSFLTLLEDVLAPAGEFFFVTDHEEFAASTREEIGSFAKFKTLFLPKGYALELPGYKSSYFEDLWRAQGKNIFYHHYQIQE